MTMKRVIFLALALSLAACKTTDDPDNTRAVGAVAGAVLGAFVGYQFGGGSGQMIMTVLGAVGGGAGGYYAADYIIKRDKKKMKKAAYKKSDTEKVTIDFAAALWESGKSEAAVNVIETWLKKHPDRINAQFELANYYLLQNRSEDAKPLLVLLAKRQPNNWIVLNNLADALKHEDRIEALRLANKALELAPTAPPVIMTYVEVSLLNGTETGKLLKLMRSLAQRYPTHAEIAILLARTTKANGDGESARMLLSSFNAPALSPERESAAAR